MARIRKACPPATPNCATAEALQRVGDWWTLLIVRDLFRGPRGFTQLAERLGVARNILTERLERMTEDGLIRKTDAKDNARWAYRLTEKGRDLLPLMVALMQWGDKWVYGPGNEPLMLVDVRDGKPVQPLALRAWDDRPLTLREVRTTPGPGETANLQA